MPSETLSASFPASLKMGCKHAPRREDGDHISLWKDRLLDEFQSFRRRLEIDRPVNINIIAMNGPDQNCYTYISRLNTTGFLFVRRLLELLRLICCAFFVPQKPAAHAQYQIYQTLSNCCPDTSLL